MNVISKFLFVLLTVVLLSSCGGRQQSNITGWNFNDRNMGGFQVVEGFAHETPPGMVFIEGGTFTMGRSGEDVMFEWNNQPRRVTVSSFFMDQFEISNLNWREYVHWMRLMFGSAPELVDRVLPDTLVWREELAFNEPFVRYYFSHIAFNHYPVVGISWEQAMDFCIWRTDRVNELRLVNAGVIRFPDFESLSTNPDILDIAQNQVFNTDKYLLNPEFRPEQGRRPMRNVFGEERRSNMSDGIMFPRFRLPTEAEWEFAAFAIRAEDGDELIAGTRLFPWDGDQLRSSERRTRGQMQANFVRGRGDMMGTSGALNDRATLTAPVYSFFPNAFGLYNMAGNVNEWVYDVYRPLSTEDIQEYNPFRGNIFVMPVFTETTVDGSRVRIPQVDSLGRVVFQVPADREAEPELFARLDVRNFRDGDPSSSLRRDQWMAVLDPDAATRLLYRPDPETDRTGLLTSGVSNTSRVFKGGSWRDRPYWLNPSARRWLEQTERRNDIGFRAAMSKVGSEVSSNAGGGR